MDTAELKFVVSDQNKLIPNKRSIERDIFGKLIKSYQNDLITIITGVRRSGKSTILQQLTKENEGFYLSFDDERLINFTVEDFQNLYELLIEMYGPRNIFYLDEIQNIKGWERFIRRLHDEGKKVFLTGSNANLLSKELGTHLTGRNIRFELYPFSFHEYLKFKDLSTEIVFDTQGIALMKANFNDYLINGGLPEFLASHEIDYLKSLYNDLIYRDIIVRYHLPNEKVVKEFANIGINSTAKPISYNSIKSYLNLGSATTISEYFSYFRECYLLFLVNCYKDSLKKQSQNPKKLYCIDNSLFSFISFRHSGDYGRMLENAVFLHLMRTGKEVFYHNESKECDFIIRTGVHITSAIQVCFELTETNKERELAGLQEAMKAYNLTEGTIITFGQEFSESNIKVIPAWKWMLQDLD